MKTIAIIGLGYSGFSIAYQLLHHTTNYKIIIFDRNNSNAKGIAYSTTCLSHLLNVHSGNMSAYENQPNHFHSWLTTRFPINNENMNYLFAPRKIYGDYLTEQLNQLKKIILID